MTIIFTGSERSEAAVSSAMFGGNNMFKYNLINGQGASFNDAVTTLGVTGIRFPGGTMTEEDFDVTRPDSPPENWPEGRPFVGISEFLNYAADTGREATIVLPTAKMFNGELDANSDIPRSIDQGYFKQVITYAERLLTYGDTGPDALPDTPITAFEIGNEYWGSGDMTPTEYGLVINLLCAELGKIFTKYQLAGSSAPEILVQMGDPWGAQFSEGIYSDLTWDQRGQQCNQNILDQLTDPKAVSAITGLVQHYYYGQTSNAISQDSQLVNYIDDDWAIWAAAGFGDRDLAITEWNIKQDNTAQFGLQGASIVLEQMEQMIRLGVDTAFAWPVQGWKTGLAGEFNDAPVLSPAGAAFQMMANSLVGLHALESNISGGGLEVNAFASKTETVLFASSRSDLAQHVSLDVSGLISGFSSVWGVKLGIGSGFAANDPTAAAILKDYTRAELFNLSTLEFDLAPFEIMQIQFNLPTGVTLMGGRGSEKLQGGLGGDHIIANSGNDSVAGGKGLDSIDGGAGHDLLSGWGGNDVVDGSAGNDLIFGQAGFDRLFGSLGNDSLYGGADADRLDGGKGRDLLTGGGGADVFVFASPVPLGGAPDQISDMQGGLDRIILDNDAFGGLWTGTLKDEAFRTGTGAGDWTDRIIHNTQTGALIWDQDGSRTGFSGIVFAYVEPGLVLTSMDFGVI